MDVYCCCDTTEEADHLQREAAATSEEVKSVKILGE
jgi:hypothetical protein